MSVFNISAGGKGKTRQASTSLKVKKAKHIDPAELGPISKKLKCIPTIS